MFTSRKKKRKKKFKKNMDVIKIAKAYYIGFLVTYFVFSL